MVGVVTRACLQVRQARRQRMAFTGHPFLVKRRGLGEPSLYRCPWA